MAKQPLTTSGAADKITELYALSTSALDIQATRILEEFGEWMDNNFELNTLQRTYINSLDAEFKRYIATEISASVRTKLPITLIIPSLPPVHTGTKRIVIGKDSDRIFDSGVISPLEGSMTITVSYER